MDNNNVNNNEQPTVVTPNEVTNTNNGASRFAFNGSVGQNVSNTPVVQSTATQSIPVVEPQPTVSTPVVPPVNPEPIVPNTPAVPTINQTTPQVNIPDVNGTDSNAMINENLKKVEINYTPPSKGKVVLLVLFFIALLGFIIFLPEISSFTSKITSGNVEPKEEIITTGKLKCSLSTNTTNLDKDYYLVFRFTDSKLEKTEFTITTKGDVTLDEETLNKLASNCKQLKENVKDMTGVVIQCNYTEGKLEEIQSFDLNVVDNKKLDAAFTEAGGNNPEYQYGQDIDTIERNMNASGYSCKRER